jgi:hypothetical protein
MRLRRSAGMVNLTGRNGCATLGVESRKIVAVKRFYGGGMLSRQCAGVSLQSPRSARLGFRNSFGKRYHRKPIIAIA